MKYINCEKLYEFSRATQYSTLKMCNKAELMTV